MLEKRATNQNTTWWHGENLSPDEIKQVQQKFYLTDDFDDFLGTPYPEVTYRTVHQQTLVVIDTFINLKHKKTNNLLFLSLPITFIALPDALITLVQNENTKSNVLEVIADNFPAYDFAHLDTFLAPLLQTYFDQIHDAAHQLSRMTRHAEAALTRSENISKELTRLISVRAGLVQLHHSMRSNLHMLRNRADFDEVNEFGEHIKANLDQTLSTVDDISKTYQNYWDVRLNKTMKELTIAGLVFAVPTIISGFYGENVSLPLAHGDWAWLGTIGMVVVLLIGLFVWLWKADYFE